MPTVFLLTLGVIWGGGLPPVGAPRAEAPLLANIAPEKCLVYLSWAGMEKANPRSQSRAERLLAEPEVRLMAAELEQRFLQMLKASFDGEDAELKKMLGRLEKLAPHLFRWPFAVYLSDIQTPLDRLQINDQPKIEGGLVVQLGPQAKQVALILDFVSKQLLAESVKTVKVAGAEMYGVNPDQADLPPFVWGVKDGCLWAGLGAHSVENMLARAKGPPPAWLKQARERLPTQRRASLFHLRLDALVRIAAGADKRFAKILEGLGLADVVSLDTATGLEKGEFVHRTLVHIPGGAKGMLAAVVKPELKLAHLRPVPGDASFAAALHLDGEKFLEELLKSLPPDPRRELDEGLREFAREMKFDFRKDVLAPLGDVWRFYHSSGDGGLMGGFTIVIDVDDAALLRKVEQRLIEQAGGVDRDGRPSRDGGLCKLSLGGRDIFYINLVDDDLPISPGWCLTDEHLVFSLFPQSLKAFVLRGKDFESLADSPEFRRRWPERAPVLLAHNNGPRLLEWVYPAIQIIAQWIMEEMRDEELDVDISIFPSPRSLARHLGVGTATLSRRADGLEFVSRQSAPGGEFLLGVFALWIWMDQSRYDLEDAMEQLAVLTSPPKAREKQSLENLRRIGMAMHRYQRLHKTLPAAFSVSDEGEPRLSWRVHLLPMLGETELYEKFHLDEPWNSLHNRTLIEQMPQVYRCPGSSAKAGRTHYLGARGNDAVFPGPKGLRLVDIRDGVSYTIMVVEASKKAVEWTKPQDFRYDEMAPARGLAGLRSGGFLALFADGSARKISAQLQTEILNCLFQRSDGKRVNYRILRGRR